MEPISFGIVEIAGLATASGLGLVGLIKSGHLNIKLGKNNVPVDVAEPEEFHDINGVAHREFCKQTHDKLDKTIMGWDEINQTMILEQQEHKITLKTHREKLEEGTVKMNQLDDKVDHIGQGVAVLLDRTKE